MWKVKRMITARIVVLTIGAGGVAAYAASGPDSKPPPAEPVGQLQTVNVLVAKSDISLGSTATLKPEQTPSIAAAHPAGTVALRSISHLNQMDIGSEDLARQPGIINVVRYGVTNPTTIQK